MRFSLKRLFPKSSKQRQGEQNVGYRLQNVSWSSGRVIKAFYRKGTAVTSIKALSVRGSLRAWVPIPSAVIFFFPADAAHVSMSYVHVLNTMILILCMLTLLHLSSGFYCLLNVKSFKRKNNFGIKKSRLPEAKSNFFIEIFLHCMVLLKLPS